VPRSDSVVTGSSSRSPCAPPTTANGEARQHALDELSCSRGRQHDRVAAVTIRESKQDDAVEALLVDQTIRIAERGGDVRIENCAGPYARRRREQLDHGAREHSALALASEHRVEEILAMVPGTGHDVALAGEDLQGLHVVDHRTMLMGSRADAADRQSPADAELQIVGNDGRRRAFLQCFLQHHAPRTARVGQHARARKIARLCKRAHRNDDAALHQRLPVDRMPVAAHGNAQIMFVGEADDARDVLYRARLEHCDRLTMNAGARVWRRRLGAGSARSEVRAPCPEEMTLCGKLGAACPGQTVDLTIVTA
jgi:hypothetical protein